MSACLTLRDGAPAIGDLQMDKESCRLTKLEDPKRLRRVLRGDRVPIFEQTSANAANGERAQDIRDGFKVRIGGHVEMNVRPGDDCIVMPEETSNGPHNDAINPSGVHRNVVLPSKGGLRLNLRTNLFSGAQDSLAELRTATEGGTDDLPPPQRPQLHVVVAGGQCPDDDPEVLVIECV